MTNNAINPDADRIAKSYEALGHSVDLINSVIDGTGLLDENAEERLEAVKRNVRHLEIMVAKDWWTNEDMTASNAAIAAGNNYISSNS